MMVPVDPVIIAETTSLSVIDAKQLLDDFPKMIEKAAAKTEKLSLINEGDWEKVDEVCQIPLNVYDRVMEHVGHLDQHEQLSLNPQIEQATKEIGRLRELIARKRRELQRALVVKNSMNTVSCSQAPLLNDLSTRLASIDNCRPDTAHDSMKRNKAPTENAASVQVHTEASLSAVKAQQQLEELQSLQEGLEQIQEVERSFLSLVAAQGEEINQIEENIGGSSGIAMQTALVIANARAHVSRWWGAQGATAGAAIGALAGLPLGPIGSGVGAAVGGFVGLGGGVLIAKNERRTQRRLQRTLAEIEGGPLDTADLSLK